MGTSVSSLSAEWGVWDFPLEVPSPLLYCDLVNGRATPVCAAVLWMPALCVIFRGHPRSLRKPPTFPGLRHGFMSHGLGRALGQMRFSVLPMPLTGRRALCQLPPVPSHVSTHTGKTVSFPGARSCQAF